MKIDIWGEGEKEMKLSTKIDHFVQLKKVNK